MLLFVCVLFTVTLPTLSTNYRRSQHSQECKTNAGTVNLCLVTLTSGLLIPK